MDIGSETDTTDKKNIWNFFQDNKENVWCEEFMHLGIASSTKRIWMLQTEKRCKHNKSDEILVLKHAKNYVAHIKAFSAKIFYFPNNHQPRTQSSIIVVQQYCCSHNNKLFIKRHKGTIETGAFRLRIENAQDGRQLSLSLPFFLS